jgi:hypothetical protein
VSTIPGPAQSSMHVTRQIRQFVNDPYTAIWRRIAFFGVVSVTLLPAASSLSNSG